MAANWNVSAKASSGLWVISVTPIAGGAPVYQCSYPAAPPNGLTLAQYKAQVAAEVQAMVVQIVAAQGNPAAVAGLDGQTF